MVPPNAEIRLYRCFVLFFEEGGWVMHLYYSSYFRWQGTKLTFLARSRLAPKFSKVVAKAKKSGAIKKKR